jgi:hypothetical protein
LHILVFKVLWACFKIHGFSFIQGIFNFPYHLGYMISLYDSELALVLFFLTKNLLRCNKKFFGGNIKLREYEVEREREIEKKR